MKWLLATLLCASTIAGAQPSDGSAGQVDLAKRHYQAATAYFDEGKYDDAVREFRASYALSRRSELLCNVAQAYLRRPDTARAVEAYEEYLRVTPAAKDRDAVRADIERLRAQCGQIVVHGLADGEELAIDGLVVGTGPLGPVLATGGARRVTSGARVALVDVPPGGDVTVDLRALPSVASAPVGPSPWYESRLGLGLALGGVAALVGGAVLLGKVGATRDAARTSTTEADYRAQRDDASRFLDAGVLLLVVSAAALGAAAVVLTLRAREKQPSPLTVWLAPAATGLCAGGTF